MTQTALDLVVEDHPLLAFAAFEARFEPSLGGLPSPSWLTDLLKHDADAPLARTEEVRRDVRDLLRHGGYKPTGRGKPASEYLVKAASSNRLENINLAVDCCNVVSLHSGLPISVIDLDRAGSPLRVAIAGADAVYEFNAAGQEIQLGGLLCLHDAAGPCANAVKDSQRTKTSDSTRRTLSIVWGCRAHAELMERAHSWYRELLERGGATTQTCPTVS